MIPIRNELLINKPREDTFRFLAQFENVPMWNYYVTSVKRISSTKNGSGTIYHQIRRDDQQKFKVIDYNPPSLITIETIDNSTPKFRRTFKLNQVDDQTHLDDTFEVDTGSPLILERLFKNRLKTAVSNNLHNLKDLLEKGETTLPDGRSVYIK
jgi:uncharacterized membrane protein